LIVTYKYIGITLKGLDNNPHEIEIAHGSDVDSLLEEISKKYETFDLELLRKCSFMVDGKKADRKTSLKKGSRVLVMKVLGGG
jgi:molybdopterin converting factor small subunit